MPYLYSKINDRTTVLRIKFILNMPWSHMEGVKTQLYSFFNLSTRREWMINAAPQPLCPRETHSIRCTWGWWGLKTCLDTYRISCPHTGSYPRPFGQQWFTILITISFRTGLLQPRWILSCSSSLIMTHYGIFHYFLFILYYIFYKVLCNKYGCTNCNSSLEWNLIP
jgi:hypothetical protein